MPKGTALVWLPGDDAPRIVKMRGYFAIPKLSARAGRNPYIEGGLKVDFPKDFLPVMLEASEIVLLVWVVVRREVFDPEVLLILPDFQDDVRWQQTNAPAQSRRSERVP